MDRYASGVARGSTQLLKKLADAGGVPEAGQPLPARKSAGFGPPQAIVRAQAAEQKVSSTTGTGDALGRPAATHRLGLIVRARIGRSLRSAGRIGRPFARRSCGQADAGISPQLPVRVDAEVLAQLDPRQSH